MNNYSEIIENGIKKYIEFFRPNTEVRLFAAIEYALGSGGKRVRPNLMLMSAKMCGVSQDDIMPFAVALECIHTYSLIHDDLPAMDNDDYRRGEPSVHKKFDEATAILAGDALLNMAYEIMLRETQKGIGRIVATRIIALSAGCIGMVNGQAKELALDKMDKKDIKEEDILGMYSDKTSALIRAAILAPYYLAESDKISEQELLMIASDIGIIFQLVDDLMDTASGADAGKTTFVNLFGEKRARQYIQFSDDNNAKSFKKIGETSADLAEYAHNLTQRIK